MVAMELEQPLPGELPEPWVERQRPLAKVAGKSPGGVGEGLLHDIRGVDSGGQAVIEVDGDHLPQSTAVSSQQPLARVVVALCGCLEQFEFSGIELAGRHRPGPPLPLTLQDGPECYRENRRGRSVSEV
jgi:hypothetical protein